MISALKQEFMLKRMRAQEERDRFVETLREDKVFDDLYTEYSSKRIQLLKAEAENQAIMLKNDMIDLKIKIDKLLKEKNVERSKLFPNYECKICNDTGVAGGRICQCLQNALSKKISLNASSQSVSKHFEGADLNIMDETDKKAMEVLKRWCESYPNVTKTNIMITGGAGSGKSFMLECVASELISKGVVVYFKTAFEINESARLYHIGKSFDFGDLLNCEILIIDDLGTEPVLKNITKEYLYNLINTRQVNNKPTFISTNLSFDDILSRYDERIFSRLSNKRLAINIQLLSSDKRLK